MNMLVNIILYQLVWLLCVFFHNNGVIPAVALLVLHLYLSPVKRQDSIMMLVLLFAGIIIDGSLQQFDILQFTGQSLPIPLWLAVIWLALATLVHHSLYWLKSKIVLSAVFGAIGGPLAYWAGVRAGAASFATDATTSLGVLAAVWFILWPLVMLVGQKVLPAKS